MFDRRPDKKCSDHEDSTQGGDQWQSSHALYYPDSHSKSFNVAIIATSGAALEYVVIKWPRRDSRRRPGD